MIKNNIKRYLNGTRTGLSFKDHSSNQDELIERFITASFPTTPEFPQIFRISSDQARWEFINAKDNERAVLIIDESLTEKLIAFQSIMLFPNQSKAGKGLVWLSAADTFRKEGYFAHYYFSAKMAQSYDDDFLNIIRPANNDMAIVIEKFLLAHEFAHIAVENDLSWIGNIKSMVLPVITSFLKHIEIRRDAPLQRPKNLQHLAGTPLEEFSEEMVRANFDAMLDCISNNDSLLEEAICDWVACLSLLGEITNVNFMNKKFPTSAFTTREKACDMLIIVRRLSMVLNFINAFRQNAENVVREDRQYRNTRHQIEGNARLNILSNLVTILNENVLNDVGFTQQIKNNPEIDAVEKFANSISRETQLYHNRLFTLGDEINVLRNSNSFAELYETKIGRTMAGNRSELTEGDMIRSKLRSTFP